MAGYKVPTDVEVAAALRRITTPQLRRAFFEGLRNPNWVAPLAKHGLFDSPPEPVAQDDGLIRDIYWPEIDYLIRVAGTVPAAVIDVLVKLGHSRNAWLRRGTFTIAASLPSDQALRLIPLIKAWLPTGIGWRTDDRDVIATCVNVLEGGYTKQGKWLANALFRPTGEKARRQASSLIDDHWYREGLPKVAKALGGDALAAIAPWLETYERQIDHFTDSSDLSSFNRTTIRSNADRYEGVEGALIDTVRDTAIDRMTSDPAGSVEILIKSPMKLMRRIALFSLASAIDAAEPEHSGPLVEAARELLYDSDSLSESCRIEYAELARATATRSPQILDGLGHVLEAASQADQVRARQWLSRDEGNDDNIDAKLEEAASRWYHRWLSAIGDTALPVGLQARLAELDVQFGAIETPLEAEDRITGWSGPNSPVSLDEMSAMSPSELAAHLADWHYTGDRWGPDPSHEGQGRQLTALLTTRPRALTGVENIVDRLRPTYIRAMLQGWAAAIKAGIELDWDDAAQFVQQVLAHPDESAFPAEGGRYDDDPDFRLAKGAAVRLLTDLAQHRDAPGIPLDRMAGFAQLLINGTEDETAWHEYVGSSSGGTDPLTISLNDDWPIRLRGLAYLAARSDGGVGEAEARSALEYELEREDPHGAASAVVGEALGRLFDGDQAWIEAHVPAWFGGPELTRNQQIALTTALAVHRYHPALYDLLSTPMQAALTHGEPLTVGWNTRTDPLREVGEWVINGIIRGHKTLDDPLARAFFNEAPASVRGEAIAHIAWEFMHATEVDPAIRDRFADLWDQRALHVAEHPEDHDELCDFYWFARSRKFDIEWWLPRLRRVLELSPESMTDRYMIGNDLARAADVDAGQALACLKLVLGSAGEGTSAAFDLSRNAVPMVIARAISAPDQQIRAEGEAYMHHLGELGYLQLESEVRAVLEGTITQEDVGD